MKTHFLIKKVTKKWRFVNIKNTDKAKNYIIHNARSLELSKYEYFYEKAWDTDILNLVAKIHECKGRQDLFIRQKPVELDRLVEIAKIQSTEASNKIEGIVTTSTRMKQLFEEKTTPRNRDEDEIMGYRDVLNTIHESNE